VNVNEHKRLSNFSLGQILKEMFEDSKGVIRSRKSKKERQWNGQKIPKG
jgi:hypothetical protein